MVGKGKSFAGDRDASADACMPCEQNVRMRSICTWDLECDIKECCFPKAFFDIPDKLNFIRNFLPPHDLDLAVVTKYTGQEIFDAIHSFHAYAWANEGCGKHLAVFLNY